MTNMPAADFLQLSDRISKGIPEKKCVLLPQSILDYADDSAHSAIFAEEEMGRDWSTQKGKGSFYHLKESFYHFMKKGKRK